MPGFNIESILSELDSLPSMPNAVDIQSNQQQNNNIKIESDTSSNSSSHINTKCGSKSESNRMIIFDWDDTLYPTTHFVTNANPITNKDLHEWGYRTYKLIKLYIELFGGNNIYIITNGIQGWIEYSLYSASQLFNTLNHFNGPKQCDTKDDDRASFNYFDEIFKLIKMHNVKIISSQYSYSNFYPNDPKKWKECTFIDVAIHHFDIEKNKNTQGIITSIGDSYDEWYAAKDCKKFLENPSNNTDQFKLQRIKLVSAPTLKHLITEWDVLIMIAENLKNLKVSYDETCIYSLSLLNENDNEECSDSDRDSPRAMNIDNDNDDNNQDIDTNE